MTNNNTNEQQLIKENEILSKIFLEMLLKHSDKMAKRNVEQRKTDEEIKEILGQPDWRKKTEFRIVSDEEGDWVGHWWSIPWLISAQEPLEIIERLKKEKKLEQQIQDAKDYLESWAANPKNDFLWKDLDVILKVKKEVYSELSLLDYLREVKSRGEFIEDQLQKQIKQFAEKEMQLQNEKAKNKELEKELEEKNKELSEIKNRDTFLIQEQEQQAQIIQINKKN